MGSLRVKYVILGSIIGLVVEKWFKHFTNNLFLEFGTAPRGSPEVTILVVFKMCQN